MKKWLCIALVALLCVNSLPLAAFAEGTTPDNEIVETHTEAPSAPPVTEAPATEAPPTEAPVTEAPVTEAPVTEAPAMEAPATEAPETEAPTTEAPATQPTETPTSAPEDKAEGNETPTDAPQEEPTGTPSEEPDKDADSALLAGPVALDGAAQLATPSNLRAVRDSSTAIYLQWRSVSTGDGYELQSSKTSDFASPVKKTIPDVTSNDYVYGGLTCGTTLYFRIRTYAQDGSDRIYSEWSNVASAQTTPDAPATLTGTATSSTAVELSWSAVSGVTGYILTRDGARIARLMSSTLKFTDGGLITGTTYRYAVYSYKTVNNVDVVSADYTLLKYTAAPPAPKTVKAVSAGINTIRLTWSAVAGATAYEVWRTTNYGADFSLRATTEANVYALSDSKNIVSGAEYSYYIITVSDGVKSLPSKIVSASAIPDAPGGIKAKYASSTAIKVSWNAVEDVTGYILEASTAKAGPYAEVYHGAELYYVHRSLSVGDGFYYRVYAYVGSYDNAIRSLSSLIVYEKTRPVRPASLKLENNLYNRIQISFAHSEGAEGYEIYRSLNGTDFSRIKTLSTSGSDDTIIYKNTGLTCGATYWYKVRAYVTTTIGSVTTKYYSAFSDIKSLRAVPNATNDVQTVLDSTASKLIITWNPVTGASGYIVSLKTNDAGSVQIGSTASNSATSFTTASLIPGNAYAAVIRPYRMVDGVQVVGAYAIGSRMVMPIPAPKKLARYADTLTSMRLTWTAIPGVSGYRVEVTGIDDSSYTLTQDVTTNSYTVTSLTAGFLYACRVRAFSIVKGVTTYGDWCDAINVKPLAPRPKSVKVRSYFKSYGALLEWTPVADVSGYAIARSETKSGGYSTIAWLEGQDVAQYNDDMSESESGRTYYYKVAAYIDVMGQKSVGSYAAAVSVKILPPTPTLTATAASPSKIRLTWTESAGADGYYIYRATAQNGPYSMAYTVTDVTTTDKTISSLATGITYYFKIRAYKTIAGTRTLSAFSSVKSAVAAPVAPTGLKATPYAKSVKLTWSKPAGATGYNICLEQNGKYVYIGTTTATSYTVKGLASGRQYQFKVAAYTDRNGKRGVGALSAAVSATTTVPKPTNLKAVCVNNSTLDLTWTAVADCSGYEVAMADGSGATYQTIGTTGAAKFRVNGLPLAETRYFKIRAYSYADGTTVYSAWTIVISARTIPVAPTKLRGSDIAKTSVGLQWTPAPGATGYRIAYRVVGTSKYTVAAVLEGDEISEYQITGLKANTQYNIMVRSLCRNDDDALVSGVAAIITVRTAK